MMDVQMIEGPNRDDTIVGDWGVSLPVTRDLDVTLRVQYRF